MALGFKFFTKDGVPGNGFLPQMSGGMLVLLTGIDFFKHYLENQEEKMNFSHLKDLLVLIALCILYFILFGIMGALISTIFFTITFLLLFNKGKWKKNLAIGVLLPILVFIGFEYLLQSGLPSGIFEGFF